MNVEAHTLKLVARHGFDESGDMIVEVHRYPYKHLPIGHHVVAVKGRDPDVALQRAIEILKSQSETTL